MLIVNAEKVAYIDFNVQVKLWEVWDGDSKRGAILVPSFKLKLDQDLIYLFKSDGTYSMTYATARRHGNFNGDRVRVALGPKRLGQNAKYRGYSVDEMIKIASETTL